MTGGTRYMIIYADQDTGDHFTLQRTPVGTFITGSIDGHTALEALTAATVDQSLEQLRAGA